MHIEIDVLEIASLLFLWFLFLWGFRLFFIIILLKIITKTVEQVKENIMQQFKNKEGEEDNNEV